MNEKNRPLESISKILMKLVLLRLALFTLVSLTTLFGREHGSWQFAASEFIEPLIDLLCLTPALLILVTNRRHIPSTLGPLTIGFRAGVLWWVCSTILLLNQLNVATGTATVAFIGVEVSRTAFFAIYLSALAERWGMKGVGPFWLGWLGVFLIVATFLSQLFWAFGGHSPSPLLFAGFSLFSFISGSIAAWILNEETF